MRAARSLGPLLATLAIAGAAHAGGTEPGDLTLPGFVGADACGQCHGGGVDGDRSFLATDSWAGTMMANAARDPVFFAALTIANQDSPGVGTYCLRCHASLGYVRGHAAPDGSALDAIDKQGVGCEVCHRARTSPVPDDPFLLGDAQLVYDDSPIYDGPFDDAKSPAHDAVADEALDDPRLCGQCHLVTNPGIHLRDASGNDTGIAFPLDTTFTEWAASEFATPGATFQGCTDCHMPKKKEPAPIVSIPGSKARDDLRMHAAVGGNLWGIQAVRAKETERAAAFSAAFDLAEQRTGESLAQAVKVTLSGAPAALTAGASFQVKVRVENLTGHKFPTGYAESRRAWIALTLVDAAMKETPLAGGYDEVTGQIQAAPATRIYRAVPGRWDGTKGEAEEHVVLHDMILADTRIPPRGFHADATTMPAGVIDFEDGQGGFHAYDEATFTLTAPDGVAGAATLEARVYYQAMTREHLSFLVSANTTDGRGTELQGIYDATGKAAPVLAAKDGASVEFPGGERGRGIDCDWHDLGRERGSGDHPSRRLRLPRGRRQRRVDGRDRPDRRRGDGGPEARPPRSLIRRRRSGVSACCPRGRAPRRRSSSRRPWREAWRRARCRPSSCPCLPSGA
jgi:hypothetical protein